MNRSKRTAGSRRTPLEGRKRPEHDGRKRPATSERVAAYVRVSAASQSDAMQRDAISRACEARGEAIGRWYVEQRTGASLARAELSRLRAAVAAGEVHTVWVYRLDRLTRSGIRDTLALLHELRGRGCIVRSVADGLPDLDGPAGEVLVAVLAWAAQVERQTIRERQAAARARLEASGGAWGRPRRLTAEKAAWVRRELRKGRTVRDIANSAGLSESTVRRARAAPRARAETSRKA